MSVHSELVFILLTGICSAADHTPAFGDFAAKPIFRGTPAEPQFTNPRQVLPNRQSGENDLLPDADDRYRTSVRLNAQRGPNFAGRYTIARWSCGTSCSSMVVVDAVTGVLYRDAPFGTLVTNGNPQSKLHEYSGLSFRKDSSLLVVEGCFDVDFREAEGKPTDCSRSYYQWIAPRFNLLRKIALPAPLWSKH